MAEETFKTRIRDMVVKIDAEFESSLGVYGPVFWNGIASDKYETATFDFLEYQARSGSRVLIDVGSATGCMVLYAAFLGMKAIATEPQELVFKALEKNVKLNSKYADSIELILALVGTSTKESQDQDVFFTSGANGPLRRELTTRQVSLISLVERFTPQDKISVKMDIEGAEYPLLSDVNTLRALKNCEATVYLSFHPGFSRALEPNPGILDLLRWRISTLIETIRFVRILNKFAEIYILKSANPLSIFAVIRALIRDQKDFLLKF